MLYIFIYDIYTSYIYINIQLNKIQRQAFMHIHGHLINNLWKGLRQVIENKKIFSREQSGRRSPTSLSPSGNRSRKKKEEEVGVGTALNVISAEQFP